MTSLDEIAAELYRQPPDGFVAARDAYAAAAKKAGDKELAKAVHDLRRPTQAAWLVNLLAYDDVEELAALLSLGEQLRAAQQELRGDQLRELSAQRHRVVDALVRTAKRLAYESGQRAGDAAAQEAAATLEAALADPEAAEAVRSGRLVTALHYAGLGSVDVSAAVARPAAPPTPGPPPADDSAERRRREEEAAAAREAAAAAEAAARVLAERDEALAAAEERWSTADADVRRLTEELEAAQHRLIEATRARTQARKEREAAERAAATARRRADAHPVPEGP